MARPPPKGFAVSGPDFPQGGDLTGWSPHSKKLALLFRSRKIGWMNGDELWIWRSLKNGIVSSGLMGDDGGELGRFLRGGLFSIIFGVLRDHSLDTASKEDVEDTGTAALRTPGSLWFAAATTFEGIQMALEIPNSRFYEPERGPYHLLLRKEARLGISDIRTHPLMSRPDLANQVLPVLNYVAFNVVRMGGTSYDTLPLITQEQIVDATSAGYMILSAYDRDPTIKGSATIKGLNDALVLDTIRTLRLATGPLQKLILKYASLTLARLSGVSPAEMVRLIMLVMNGEYDPRGLLRLDTYMLIYHYLRLGDEWGNEFAEGIWAADDYTPHVAWISSLQADPRTDIPDEQALFGARQTAVTLWEATFTRGPEKPKLAARAIRDGIILFLGELSLDRSFFSRLQEAVQVLVVNIMSLLDVDAATALGNQQIYRMARRVYHLEEEKPLAYKTWTTLLAGSPDYPPETPLHKQPVSKAPGCKKICNDKGEDLLVCSRCKKVAYCSAVCQKKDWKRHKPACAKE